MNKQELLGILKEKEIVMGYKRSLDLLKEKKAENIIVSNNCPKDYLNSLGKVETYDGSSKDLGIVCGKPFNIAVISVIK